MISSKLSFLMGSICLANKLEKCECHEYGETPDISVVDLSKLPYLMDLTNNPQKYNLCLLLTGQWSDNVKTCQTDNVLTLSYNRGDTKQ